MKVLRGLIFCLTGLTLSVVVHGKSQGSNLQEARFVTYPIPLMVESADKGLFIELTREIAKRNKQKVSITVLPFAKAQLTFANGKFHGFFPGHSNNLPKKVLRSESFYEKRDFIFYRKGHEYGSIQSVEGKKVGLTFRYMYVAEAINNKKIRFETAEDDFANIKKLGEEKIDAFIIEESSGLKAIRQAGLENITYNKSHPLSIQEVYYGFEADEFGQVLTEKFNSTLREMKADGSLERLLRSKSILPSESSE